jgi:hypothetical protein
MFMKKYSVAAGLAVIACTSAGPVLSSTGVSLVKAVYSDLSNGNLVYIQLVTPPSSKPACATNPNVDYAFDASTPAGKVLYATLLTAYAAQTQVSVGGYNTSALGGAYSVQAEDLRWVRAQ